MGARNARVVTSDAEQLQDDEADPGDADAHIAPPPDGRCKYSDQERPAQVAEVLNQAFVGTGQELREARRAVRVQHYGWRCHYEICGLVAVDAEIPRAADLSERPAELGPERV